MIHNELGMYHNSNSLGIAGFISSTVGLDIVTVHAVLRLGARREQVGRLLLVCSGLANTIGQCKTSVLWHRVGVLTAASCTAPALSRSPGRSPELKDAVIK